MLLLLRLHHLLMLQLLRLRRFLQLLLRLRHLRLQPLLLLPLPMLLLHLQRHLRLLPLQLLLSHRPRPRLRLLHY
jgi:hypothetical protein